MQRTPYGLLFAISIVLGVAIFAVGFRLTSEVTVVLAALVLLGGALALAFPHRGWLWGLGLGIGTRISDLAPSLSVFHEPPLTPEHIAREGASKPLSLPFGLTGNPLAEWIAGSLLIMMFPFIGGCIGSIVRKTWASPSHS